MGGAITAQRIVVYAPATSANLNVGFDALGLALQPMDESVLGDLVELEILSSDAPPFELLTRGPFAGALPACGRVRARMYAAASSCSALSVFPRQVCGLDDASYFSSSSSSSSATAPPPALRS